jgi:DNA-directed RNA polymerase sigma subunit (sigma70/sigma32)
MEGESMTSVRPTVYLDAPLNDDTDSTWYDIIACQSPQHIEDDTEENVMAYLAALAECKILTLHQVDVVYLRIVEGRRFQDIARMYGITYEEARNRFYNTVKRLRQLFSDNHSTAKEQYKKGIERLRKRYGVMTDESSQAV